jgi:hypothetical protein
VFFSLNVRVFDGRPHNLRRRETLAQSSTGPL